SSISRAPRIWTFFEQPEIRFFNNRLGHWLKRRQERNSFNGSTVQTFNVNLIRSKRSSRSTAALRSNRSTTEEQIPIVPMVPSLARFQT
ncbi:MAG: hypothetical protein ACXW53_14210, partial [Candidatus Binatia bacterium]